MALAEIVAKNIHSAVYSAGYNNSALAIELGVTRQAISQKMRGEAPFNIKEIEVVAKWLNIPAAELVRNPEAGDATA